MDNAKCKALKEELAAQPEPQLISVERFFDGNDDPGSIGCNLTPHPGIPAFRDILSGLLGRAGVQAVYAQIYELDPGDGCWPFADTVLVVGTISADELADAVTLLQPSTIEDAKEFGISSVDFEKHDSPVLAIWWD
jgi:hypothetical protein